MEPGTRDLGYFVREMANAMRTWSFQLHHLSDQLIRDESLPEKTSENYQKARRLIQVSYPNENMECSHVETFRITWTLHDTFRLNCKIFVNLLSHWVNSHLAN